MADAQPSVSPEVLQQFKGAKVVEAPAADAGRKTVDPTVLERFKGARVVAGPEEKFTRDVADATETMLDKAPEDQSWFEWGGAVGRNMYLGLTDPIAALIVHQTMKDDIPDLTYRDALKAVRDYGEKSDSVSAQIVGLVSPGGLAGGLAKGGTKLAAKAGALTAARAGMVDGAVKFAAKHPTINRVLTTAASGGAGAFIEEGVRASIGEAIDAGAGKGFDGSRILESAATGAIIGGLMTPVTQEALRGAKGAAQWLGGVFGLSGRDDLAQRKILKVFANEGESLDDAVERLRDTVQRFKQNNGYAPAMTDLLPPEKVRELSEVIRYVSGLDTRARELGEAGVRRALKAYDNAIGAGNTLSREQIESAVEDLFTDVVSRNRMVPVDVPADTLDMLSRNRGWIASLANDGNAGAQRITRVIDAYGSIGKLRQNLRKFSQTRDVAGKRAEVASIRDEIARIIDEQFSASEVEPSRLAMLRNLEQLRRAATDLLAAKNRAGHAVMDETTAGNLVKSAQRVIDDYEADGLKISLGDANQIRSTASRHFYKASDPAQADTARAIRDAVAPVGVKEVPEYGAVVKRWSQQMTRSEAQETGVAAARGNIDLGDLETRIRKARLPDKPRAKGASVAALRQGADEGARRELAHEAQGSLESGVRSALRVAENSNVQRGLQMTSPLSAAKITEVAKQVKKTYDNALEMMGPRSQSASAQERERVREIATGLLFGGIGGAARANLLARIYMHVLGMPRAAARKMVEMTGDPQEMDKVLNFMESRGIRLGPLFGAIAARLSAEE